MATFIPEAEDSEVNSVKDEDNLTSVVCSICFDFYKNPRKLPACGHSFCETCILRLVSSLKSCDKLGQDLNCPVCRQIIPSPGEQNLQEWLQNLEPDNQLVDEVKVRIGEGNSYRKAELCIWCKESKKTKTANRYCLVCQEYFCENCCEFVHRFKGLRGHKIVDLHLVKTDQEIFEIMTQQMQCPQHPDMIVTHLRSIENTFCCDKCAIEDFKEMKCATNISENTTEENMENAGKLRNKIDSLTKLSIAIIDTKKENLNENKRETENVNTQLRDIRTKVIGLLDVMEENVTQKCKAIGKKYALDTEEDIRELQCAIRDLMQAQLLLETSTQQDAQNILYVTIHNLGRRLKDLESVILEKKQVCVKQGFEIHIEDQLENILKIGPNETDELITVKETKKPVSLPDYSERRLLKDCVIPKGIQYQLGEVKEMSRKPLYAGIAEDSSNHIILVDNINGVCHVIDDQYQFIDSCKLSDEQEVKDSFSSNQPVSATFLNNDMAAVSIPGQRKLIFVTIDVANKNVEIAGEMRTNKHPFAICRLRNSTVAVSWCMPYAFGIIKFCSDYRFEELVYFDRDKSGRIFKSFWFIAIDESRSHVIQPCVEDKAVYCFDFQGNPKFAYTHSELVKPQGVAVDDDGNIYVCEINNSCIHVISPEGHLQRLIKDTILRYPHAILYRREKTDLVVTCALNSHVIVFKLGR